MSTLTFEARLIFGLQSLGYVVDQTNRSRFTKMTKDGKNYFVGRSGALRVGHNSTNSVSVGNPSDITPLYKRILDAGEAFAAQAMRQLEANR